MDHEGLFHEGDLLRCDVDPIGADPAMEAGGETVFVETTPASEAAQGAGNLTVSDVHARVAAFLLRGAVPLRRVPVVVVDVLAGGVDLFVGE